MLSIQDVTYPKCYLSEMLRIQMLPIRNVTYTRCYQSEMIPIRNVIYPKCQKCYLDEMLPKRNVTIRICTINITNPTSEVITISGLSDPDSTL